MAKYTEESAIKKLIKNKIKVEGKNIYVENAGLGVLGAVDYLIKFCGFVKKTKK